MNILLDVWREACRHIEITESADAIARLLASRLPASLLVVRRFDLEHQRVETVTVGQCGAAPRPLPTRTECAQAQMRALLDWCATGAVIGYGGAPGKELMAFLSPDPAASEALAGPLRGDAGPLGALVVIADKETKFRAADAELVRSLLEPLSVALANHDRLHELARLREALEADKQALLARLDRQDIMEALVGQDSGLRPVMERVEQVAPTDAPVLILGETGTGKEVVARAIHAKSRRAHGPIVRVNCGALAMSLVDSELFGHERGSFTGAVAARKGWFERADGGTLFLDEVAELPLDAQVRLLRILQDGTFERVGGQKQLTVDVRIVAATHRDLPSWVSSGRFREDLWYRLGVFPIRLPPLRERIEDIPALAAHFARRAGLRLAGAPLTPSSDDVERLVRYAWPGNVRELAAVIERAAILGEGRSLRIATSLGESGSPEPAGAARSEAAPPRAVSTRAARSPDDSLDDAMRAHIERSLQECFGRIEGRFGAAARLGVNPHTLRSRMRKLAIDWKRYRK